MSTVVVNGIVAYRNGKLVGEERAYDLLRRASGYIYAKVEMLRVFQQVLDQGIAEMVTVQATVLAVTK